VVRDQPWLLPLDMNDWVPDDDVGRFIVEVVSRLDLSELEASYVLGGPGREAFDPGMMTALLIYAYSQGVRSSREIARRCRTDMVFMWVTARQIPDHCTISDFRANHLDVLTGLMRQVLRLCREAGMVKVGVVAIDSTKIMGRATTRGNRTEDDLCELAQQLMAEAARIDELEDQTGGREDYTPPGFPGGPAREQWIRGHLADQDHRPNINGDTPGVVVGSQTIHGLVQPRVGPVGDPGQPTPGVDPPGGVDNPADGGDAHPKGSVLGTKLG